MKRVNVLVWQHFNGGYVDKYLTKEVSQAFYDIQAKNDDNAMDTLEDFARYLEKHFPDKTTDFLELANTLSFYL